MRARRCLCTQAARTGRAARGPRAALYTETTLQAAIAKRDTLRAVLGLGVTQIIGWGCSFTAITIFGSPIGETLGLQREVVFAGLTLLLLVSAMLAPRIGKLVDRLGARPVMVAGSVIAALAMLAQSMASGVVTYMLGWVLFGIAMPMALNNAAMPGLVQIVGPGARRAITGLTLLTGLTGTVFLPLSAFLLDRIGWRNAYLLFAALHIVVCVPVHLLVLRRRGDPDVSGGGRSKQMPPPDGLLPPDVRRRAFILLTVWTCTEGLLTWGLYMQVIDVLRGMGIPRDTAVWIWALVGPAQAAARFAELLSGGRHSILTTALGSSLMTSTSFLAFLLLGVTGPSTVVFCLLMGLGHGLFAVARNTLPLALFGAREFGSYMGLLTVPQNIVNAVAPILFAFIIARMSPAGALMVAGCAAVLGCVAVVLLVSFCKPHMAGSGGNPG